MQKIGLLWLVFMTHLVVAQNPNNSKDTSRATTSKAHLLGRPDDIISLEKPEDFASFTGKKVFYNGSIWVEETGDITVTDPGYQGILLPGTKGNRYRRVYEGAINVKWFGAKGGYMPEISSGPDDYLAFSKALTAAYAMGSALSIPTDTYFLSRTVSLKNITPGKRIKIIGNGATIIQKPGYARESRIFSFEPESKSSFIITPTSSVSARQLTPLNSQASFLLNNSDYEKVSNGDVLLFETYQHSTDSAYNNKLWSREWSTIMRKSSENHIIIPNPIMAVYATKTQLGASPDYLITNQGNQSAIIPSIRVFKQYYLDISDLNFVTDFREATGNIRCVYAIQAVTHMVNCTLKSLPEEGGVDDGNGLSRSLIYLGSCRDAVIESCRLDNYGYGIWLNRGYNAIINNISANRGRHLITSHMWTNVTASNIVVSLGGAIDAHGGASDWTLTNVVAANAITPTDSSGIDLNNIRIQAGNIRLMNCSFSNPLFGRNDNAYWKSVFRGEDQTYAKTGYDARIATSSLSAVNCRFRSVNNWGKNSTFTNCIIDKLYASEQILSAPKGTVGAMPALVSLKNCYTSSGTPLGASSNNQDSRNVLISGEAQGFGLFGEQGKTVATYGNQTGEAKPVRLNRKTLFIVLSPDQVQVPLSNPAFTRAISNNEPGMFNQNFDCTIPIPALDNTDNKYTLVFLLGNHGLNSPQAKLRASIELTSLTSGNTSLISAETMSRDNIDIYLTPNQNTEKPQLFKNFTITKPGRSETVYSVDAVRTWNRTKKLDNMVGFPKDLQGAASARQCEALAQSGFELDISLNIPSTSFVNGIIVKGTILTILK